MFANLDIVGWYSLGDLPSSAMMRVHKALCADTAAALLVNTSSDEVVKNVDKASLMASSSAAIACTTPLLLLLNPDETSPVAATELVDGEQSACDDKADCTSRPPLPIALFESCRTLAGDNSASSVAMDVCDDTSIANTGNATSHGFKRVQYEMATDASERIAIDQVSAVSTQQAGVS